MLLWPFGVWDLVGKAEARTLSDSKMLGAADLDILGGHSRNLSYHCTDMDSEGSLWKAQVTSLDLSSMIKDFSDWKWLLHHLDVLAACNQISKPFRYFPVPDVTNALPDLFHCSFQFFPALMLSPITSFPVCSPSQSQCFWGRYVHTSQTSDFLRSFSTPYGLLASTHLLRFD